MRIKIFNFKYGPFGRAIEHERLKKPRGTADEPVRNRCAGVELAWYRSGASLEPFQTDSF